METWWAGFGKVAVSLGLGEAIAGFGKVMVRAEGFAGEEDRCGSLGGGEGDGNGNGNESENESGAGDEARRYDKGKERAAVTTTPCLTTPPPTTLIHHLSRHISRDPSESASQYR